MVSVFLTSLFVTPREEGPTSEPLVEPLTDPQSTDRVEEHGAVRRGSGSTRYLTCTLQIALGHYLVLSGLD